MRKKTSLFTTAERRLALWALLAAAVLTLTLMSVEHVLSPSLGLYASNLSAPSLPNVIDAQPLARAL